MSMAIADKPLMGLTTNLVGELIMGLSRLIEFWLCSNGFLLFPSYWFVKQFDLKLDRCNHYETGVSCLIALNIGSGNSLL